MAITLLQIYEERQNKPRELVWMKRAAQCGCPTSLHRVLKLFQADETHRSNKTEWYHWFLFGVDDGSIDEEELRSLEETMHPQELNEARHSYATVFATQCYPRRAAANDARNERGST